MKGGAAEAEFFAFGCERSGGGEGGNAENDVVVGVNIAVEGELFAVGVPDFVGEVEVGAVGGAVGEHFAAGHTEFAHDALLESEVEFFMSFFLDGEAVVLEEGEIFDQIGGLIEVSEDANAAALGGREDLAEEA